MKRETEIIKIALDKYLDDIENRETKTSFDRQQITTYCSEIIDIMERLGGLDMFNSCYDLDKFEHRLIASSKLE